MIPYEKLSKKEKRKLDAAKRNTWGSLNPVTRKPASSKAYNRSKARNWKREIHETNSGLSFFGSAGQIDKIVGIQPSLLQSHHPLIRLHFPKLSLLQSGSTQLKPLPPQLQGQHFFGILLFSQKPFHNPSLPFVPEL